MSDLHLIMMSVQKLVDAMLPPDDLGQQAHSPAILRQMQDVQDTISDALHEPRQPLIAPDLPDNG